MRKFSQIFFKNFLQVTIHNINEAKFLRAQQQQSNGVEITRIPAVSTNGVAPIEPVQSSESLSISDLLTRNSFFTQQGLGGDTGYDRDLHGKLK